MPSAIEFVSFRLKKGTSVPDFLLVSDKMNIEFLSVQKGYISRKLLAKGEMWADFVIWETMDDALNAAEAFGENDTACEYMSFIDDNSVDMRHLNIEKNY